MTINRGAAPERLQALDGFEGFSGRLNCAPYHRRVRRILIPTLCLSSALAALACAPLPLIQDATVLRKGALKVGGGVMVGMPLDPETYFEPDGPGSREPADSDLQYMPLANPMGWTRYGLGHGFEFTSAFHIPTFVVDLGLKWSPLTYEAGDIFTFALAVDVGTSLAFPSLTTGASLITSWHLSEEISLDLASRFGAMSGLWGAPNLTSTLGLSIGRRTTIRLAIGYVHGFDLPMIEGLEPSPAGLFVGGGWEY